MATDASRHPVSGPPLPPDPAPDLATWFPPHARVRVAALGALFVILHLDILTRLYRFARTDGDWSHALLVPFFSLYFIYQHRERIAAATARVCWPGLAVMLAGLGAYAWALLAGNDMLKGYAMLVELLGLTLLMVGPGVMRWLWFPIVYLVFAVKVNEPLWAALAWQLQLIAANGAVAILNALGMDAVVTTTTLEFWSGAQKLTELTVAEACSGMRMLMTFVALGVAVAYGWDRPAWARLVMVLLTPVIALMINILRVTALGLLSLVDPEYIKGDFHVFLGMLMLIPALALFIFVGWILGLLTEHHDDEQTPDGSAAPTEASP
ncbi:MAG: exosortase/archaeosortase family protein [Planctomycetota bacterium]|jgi:exosortase